MPSPKKRFYWDANVFITLLSNLTPEATRDRQIVALIIQGAMDDKVEIIMSALGIAEVLDTKENPIKPIPETIRAAVRILFEEPYITLVTVDASLGEEARELRWQYPWLKTPDAIHIASAVFAKVDEMQTYDGRGKKKGILDLDGQVGNPPLRIVEPNYEAQLQAFREE